MNGTGNTRTAVFNCPNCGAASTQDSHVCAYCGSSIATRICPSCFGHVSVGMKHCPRCGTAVSDSTQKKESSFKCPLCETVLSQATVGNNSLYECIQCGGLWIDKTSFQFICTGEEEQEAVLRFRFEENPKSDNRKHKRKRAYIPCPECGKLMNHKNFSRCSGIILDWCRDHGSWFDRRELQQIVSFIRKGGLQKAREKERRNLQVEKERLRMKEFKIAVHSNRTDTLSGNIPSINQSDNSILQFLQKTFLD